MLKEAIYHKADGVFAYPTKEDELFIQLKAKKGDLDRVFIHYDGRFTGWDNGQPKYSVEMKKDCSDDLFDYFVAKITYSEKKFSYCFLVDDGLEKHYYTSQGFFKELPDRKKYFEYTYICEQDYFSTPDWVQNAVFYQIFPERFKNGDSNLNPESLTDWEDRQPKSDSFYGGDLEGIIDGLDYLDELGIDAIYLTPIFESSSNHKYNISDYKKIDPAFGDLDTFKELVDQAHQRGIKVVLDGVFNHTSDQFFAFQDLLENGEDSDYKDWYYIDEFPIRKNPGITKSLTEEFISELKELPEINTKRVSEQVIPKLDLANDKTEEYILKLAANLNSEMELTMMKIWQISRSNEELKQVAAPNYETFASSVWKMPKLKTANSEVREYFLDVARYWIEEADIDGWRLDVADEIDHYFWREFRKTVKDAKPEAYIVGEAWNDASAWLKGDQFDGIMNYLFTEAVWDFFCKRDIDSADFKSRLTKVKTIYKEPAKLASLNLIGSHDTERALTIADNNINRLKLAAAFQMSYVGVPMIYYGDEVGISGGKDPDCRRPMIWEASNQNHDLLEWYKKLIEIRTDNPALRTGKLDLVKEDVAHNIYSFLRTKEDNKVLVIFNNGNSKVDLEFDLNRLNLKKEEFTDLLTDKSSATTDNKLKLSLPAYSVKILK
jgi:glycosidase